MSRLAAPTMRARSLVSSAVELSSDSSEYGTRNWPTVAPQRRCVSLIQRSVAERVSGDAAGVGAAPVVRISTWARYDAQGVILPSTAKRARRRKNEAVSPSVSKRGWREPGSLGGGENGWGALAGSRRAGKRVRAAARG